VTKRHVPSFGRATVSDAMDPQVLVCAAETPLALVAQMMALERAHRIVVEKAERSPRGWAIVSDLHLIAAAVGGDARTAGASAADDFVVVTPDETLGRAAQIMVEHQTTHIIVVDPSSDRPLGTLSTLDLALALTSSQGGRATSAE
jgi:CBS domain-containing protein